MRVELRFPARQTMHLKRKAKNASEEAKKVAWRAQKRLCGRYRKLMLAGKTLDRVPIPIKMNTNSERT